MPARLLTGFNPKSLGCINLPLKPVKDKTLLIEPTGEVSGRDEFGLVEITGKKLEGTVGTVSKGTLEIIEAEVYESLPPSKR